jgi:heme exporter protein B
MKSPLWQSFRLLRHEWQMERRKTGVVAGTFLYLSGTIFVSFQAYGTTPDPRAWNAILWIILLFNALYAVSNGIAVSHPGKQLYYYFLAHPLALLWAKMGWTTIWGLITGAVGLCLFCLFMGIPEQANLFSLVYLLIAGLSTLCATLSFVGLIASKTNQGNQLTALIGLPLLIPTLIWLVNGTELALFSEPAAWLEGHRIMALNIALWLAASALFPYIWRD